MVAETRPITDHARAGGIATELSRLLADSYATYTKTLHYHWNVRGPHFYSLHQLFEEQYLELHAAIDVIAERIRQLGADTPPFGAPMDSLTAVRPDIGSPTAMGMVHELIEANETRHPVRARRGDRGRGARRCRHGGPGDGADRGPPEGAVDAALDGGRTVKPAPARPTRRPMLIRPRSTVAMAPDDADRPGGLVDRLRNVARRMSLAA